MPVRAIPKLLSLPSMTFQVKSLIIPICSVSRTSSPPPNCPTAFVLAPLREVISSSTSMRKVVVGGCRETKANFCAASGLTRIQLATVSEIEHIIRDQRTESEVIAMTGRPAPPLSLPAAAGEYFRSWQYCPVRLH